MRGASRCPCISIGTPGCRTVRAGVRARVRVRVRARVRIRVRVRVRASPGQS